MQSLCHYHDFSFTCLAQSTSFHGPFVGHLALRSVQGLPKLLEGGILLADGLEGLRFRTLETSDWSVTQVSKFLFGKLVRFSWASPTSGSSSACGTWSSLAFRWVEWLILKLWWKWYLRAASLGITVFPPANLGWVGWKMKHIRLKS